MCVTFTTWLESSEAHTLHCESGDSIEWLWDARLTASEYDDDEDDEQVEADDDEEEEEEEEAEVLAEDEEEDADAEPAAAAGELAISVSFNCEDELLAWLCVCWTLNELVAMDGEDETVAAAVEAWKTGTTTLLIDLPLQSDDLVSSLSSITIGWEDVQVLEVIFFTSEVLTAWETAAIAVVAASTILTWDDVDTDEVELVREPLHGSTVVTLEQCALVRILLTFVFEILLLLLLVDLTWHVFLLFIDSLSRMHVIPFDDLDDVNNDDSSVGDDNDLLVFLDELVLRFFTLLFDINDEPVVIDVLSSLPSDVVQIGELFNTNVVVVIDDVRDFNKFDFSPFSQTADCESNLFSFILPVVLVDDDVPSIAVAAAASAALGAAAAIDRVTISLTWSADPDKGNSWVFNGKVRKKMEKTQDEMKRKKKSERDKWIQREWDRWKWWVDLRREIRIVEWSRTIPVDDGWFTWIAVAVWEDKRGTSCYCCCQVNIHGLWVPGDEEEKKRRDKKTKRWEWEREDVKDNRKLTASSQVASERWMGECVKY